MWWITLLTSCYRLALHTTRLSLPLWAAYLHFILWRMKAHMIILWNSNKHVLPCNYMDYRRTVWSFACSLSPWRMGHGNGYSSFLQDLYILSSNYKKLFYPSSSHQARQPRFGILLLTSSINPVMHSTKLGRGSKIWWWVVHTKDWNNGSLWTCFTEDCLLGKDKGWTLFGEVL